MNRLYLKLSLAASLAVAFGCMNPGIAADASKFESTEWTIVDISVLPPVQIPIPWGTCSTGSSSWGEKTVFGFSFGLPYADHPWVCGLDAGVYQYCRRSMYGCQAGIVARNGDMVGLQLGAVTWNDECEGVQLGIFNRSRTFAGLQLGIVNYVQEATCVQIGLWNVNESGYFLASPILNMSF